MNCKTCGGKVIVDMSFTDNKNYELLCLRCGKRVFVGRGNPLFPYIEDYVRKTQNT